MKASAFDYARVESLEEVFALFAEYGDEARIIAGGQTLVPAMAMRVAAPALLIDISRLEALQGIARNGDRLRIGAFTRYVELQHSPLVAEAAPLLHRAIPLIAHEAIRSRGTFGGSLANADPASEMPACALALEAVMVIANAEGERRVAAADFFQGLYQTALEPGDVLVAVEIPVAQDGMQGVIEELVRRQGDYAMVGLAATGKAANGMLSGPRFVFFGVGDRPVLATKAAEALADGPISPEHIAEAQAALAQDFTPLGDIHCSPATKAHLARVLLGRVVSRLLEHR
ncbi:xanthine dehydrogenase family protein subunit M [Telmatospirillum sp. J64-1]|uniref:FAD binding domain-containing protein n=1 Tax=Telmatospirillum sp. J64-1 TaxID=2502183 RepID=UPI00115F5021|nr:xanthine dehydrogenase family protein subunit M [Telmatospirillum sp. J64-1]